MPVTDRNVRNLSAWVESALDSLVDGIGQRLREDVPEFFEDEGAPHLHANRQAIRANLAAVADGLEDGRRVPEDVPAGAIEEALMSARNGIAWSVLDQTYRVGHAYLWERTLEEISRWEVAEYERSGLLQQVSRYYFDYVDGVTASLAKVYDAERQRLLGRRERRRIALVRDVLSGVEIDSMELGYHLAGKHLAVVASGDRGEPAIVELGDLLRTKSIVVGGPQETVWAWFLVTGDGADVDRALGGLETDPATGIGVGTVATGIFGFRRSHAEAVKAHELGARYLPSTSVVRYDEVALESLLLRGETAARAFAHSVLGELAGDDERSRGQRETLRAYFATGNNGASAAALLGVHERTIGYRLTSIEQRLGADLTERQDELAVALRILAVLSPDG